MKMTMKSTQFFAVLVILLVVQTATAQTTEPANYVTLHAINQHVSPSGSVSYELDYSYNFADFKTVYIDGYGSVPPKGLISYHTAHPELQIREAKHGKIVWSLRKQSQTEIVSVSNLQTSSTIDDLVLTLPAYVNMMHPMCQDVGIEILDNQFSNMMLFQTQKKKSLSLDLIKKWLIQKKGDLVNEFPEETEASSTAESNYETIVVCVDLDVVELNKKTKKRTGVKTNVQGKVALKFRFARNNRGNYTIQYITYESRIGRRDWKTEDIDQRVVAAREHLFEEIRGAFN